VSFSCSSHYSYCTFITDIKNLSTQSFYEYIHFRFRFHCKFKYQWRQREALTTCVLQNEWILLSKCQWGRIHCHTKGTTSVRTKGLTPTHHARTAVDRNFRKLYGFWVDEWIIIFVVDRRPICWIAWDDWLFREINDRFWGLGDFVVWCLRWTNEMLLISNWDSILHISENQVNNCYAKSPKK